MRKLRWTSGVTREDRTRNEYVRAVIGVTSIVGKMRENSLKLFGDVMKRGEAKTVRVVLKINVKGKRGRGRPKKRWLDTIENNMRAVGVCVRDVENRNKRRFRTKMADPKKLGERRRRRRRRRRVQIKKFELYISTYNKYPKYGSRGDDQHHSLLKYATGLQTCLS